MLFSSFEFIFGFLPLAVCLYALARRFGISAGVWSLSICSLAFYSWWLPYHTPLLIISICANYGLSKLVTGNRSKLVLGIGVAGNLAVLAYFKYSGFLSLELSKALGTDSALLNPVLPLAISFFTFQQIAFLVDCYRAKTSESSFPNYLLFVVFFPHLIAGPIVHHRDYAPQARRIGPLSMDNAVVGTSIFLLGLFKKVVIADGLRPISDNLFHALEIGHVATFGGAWTGMLAYTLFIYFDFSAYSDMAIGLARIFGITFPANFNAPYKASSIIEFWRRWHITLSTFLRDYLYIPLGGNRVASYHVYLNLIIVMTLGGLWHGAGWTFVLWGAFHGVLLAINRLWRTFQPELVRRQMSKWPLELISTTVTFIAVVFGWVLFRAPDLPTAMSVFRSMLGMNRWAIVQPIGPGALPVVGFLLLCVFILPTTQSLMKKYRPTLDSDAQEQGSWLERRIGRTLDWRPSVGWAMGIALLTMFSLSYLGGSTKFLYFQF
jgi:alginate O-acetyltransferase complex protein AlgI